MLNGLNS
jgi:hypothetical protein